MRGASSLISVLIVSVTLLASGGCKGQSADPPQTYPVAGVVLSGDGAPLTGGAVYFRAADEKELEAVAEVQADGTFELYTMFHGQRLTGAVAGEHDVTVVPPSGAGGISPAIAVAEKARVTPGENRLTIELPRWSPTLPGGRR